MIEILIGIKPLSVNEAWQGTRFKTKKYLSYEKELLFRLPQLYFPYPNKPLKVIIEYGFTNNASDIDNPTKLILDILQKKYKFNDKNIVELLLRKKIVKKGQEYIQILINEFKN
jgi:Holliday junction resolvase RusA-like endonuclease